MCDSVDAGNTHTSEQTEVVNMIDYLYLSFMRQHIPINVQSESKIFLSLKMSLEERRRAPGLPLYLWGKWDD